MELAADYIQLRQRDEEKRLLDDTAAGYARFLPITQNKYTAGVVGQERLASAQSQLASAQADDVDLIQQRARARARHRHPRRPGAGHAHLAPAPHGP